MSNIINQNLDEIISIKNQLSNVLIENGIEAGNRFSDYPDMFRSVIASGGSFNPSYYYTADEIDENFVSYSYLAAALEDIDVDVDLDEYVTYSYAYNTFVSYAYLGDLEQISEYILGSGSSSAPENVYATKVELASYATKLELGAYATKVELGSYVSKDLLSTLGYITAADVDLSSYSLKSDLHSYLSVSNWSTGDYDIQLRKTGLTLISTNHTIAPATIAYDYINDSSYTNAWIGLNTLKNYTEGRLGGSIAPKSTDTYFLGDTSSYYHTLYVRRIEGSSINLRTGGNNRLTVTGTTFRPMQQNYDLGSSDYPFATAYISNIYNFIWTGTSAEYAALDNYTTYQIYLIQEA